MFGPVTATQIFWTLGVVVVVTVRKSGQVSALDRRVWSCDLVPIDAQAQGAAVAA